MKRGQRFPPERASIVFYEEKAGGDFGFRTFSGGSHPSDSPREN